MAHILDQFLEQRELVRNLSHQDDRIRLAGLLEWLESEVETKRILDELRRNVDASKLIPERTGYPHPPGAKTLPEVRAFGLFLMEGCRQQGHGLYLQSHTYNIKPRYGKHASDYINEAMEKFVNPFLDFVEKELAAREDTLSPEDVLELRFGTVLSPEFAQHFPKTAECLTRVGDFCGSAHADGAWFNVGNSCREAFQTFVEELRGLGFVAPDENLKKGNVKGHLRQFLGVTGSSGSHEIAVADLVDAAWALVCSTLHRSATTKEEALRTYLWTSLVIAEVFALALSQREFVKT